MKITNVKLKAETYQCIECKSQRIIWRREGKLRKKEHLKNMFCPSCNKVNQTFIKID